MLICLHVSVVKLKQEKSIKEMILPFFYIYKLLLYLFIYLTHNIFFLSLYIYVYMSFSITYYHTFETIISVCFLSLSLSCTTHTPLLFNSVYIQVLLRYTHTLSLSFSVLLSTNTHTLSLSMCACIVGATGSKVRGFQSAYRIIFPPILTILTLQFLPKPLSYKCQIAIIFLQISLFDKQYCKKTNI